MTKFLRMLGLLTVLGVLGGAPLQAAPNDKEGRLIVIDEAKFFSENGIKKAQDEFARLHSKIERQVTVRTVTKIEVDPAKLKSDADKQKFWTEATRDHARREKARGVYILISKSPGHIHVLADDELVRKGFDGRKETELRDLITKNFREATKIDKPEEQVALRDKALLAAADFLESNLPTASTATPARKGVLHPAASDNNHAANDVNEGPRKSNIMGWLCPVMAALLGVWVVMALIRAFTGGGGGGGGPGGGGPGYGGGGGFFGNFLGGMFGAAAGMWMYNSFFGGHSSTAFGGDNYGNGDTGNVDDAGAGNWDRDQGSGGDYGSGDAGGGDWGGGGDFGGGDFGGGDF